MDQIAALLQALQQRQIPPLTAPAPPPATVQPAAASAAAQPDALAMLRVILTNPQLQQALRSAAPAGAPMARTVQLPVPTPAAPQQLRPVPIPLQEVLRAVLSLAGHTTTGRVGEDVGDDDAEFPEYLVGEDGRFLIDPANADDRLALVGHLFLLNDAARRRPVSATRRRPGSTGGGWDKSDEWARAAGFF